MNGHYTAMREISITLEVQEADIFEKAFRVAFENRRNPTISIKKSDSNYFLFFTRKKCVNIGRKGDKAEAYITHSINQSYKAE